LNEFFEIKRYTPDNLKECFFHKYILERKFDKGFDYHFIYLTHYLKDCKTILVEKEYVDRDYILDFSNFYVRCFEDYSRKCKRLHFFKNEFDENDAGLADRLKNLYSKRWGIETSYRVKHGFRGKTTSKNYMIRQFYFMFSVLLYNLWILADVLIWLHLFGKVGEKHLIVSKDFGTDLMTIDPGG